LRALAVALAPTILLTLAIGAWFAHRASQRFKRVHDAIVRIMNGDLDLRLPFAGDDDIDKIARAVNLMLDEIAVFLSA
jgi:methyl-accepting chemotaxis protein